jgi:hypothetical protein
MSKKPSRVSRPLITDVMKARQAADGVVRRAVSDSAFRKSLRADPVSTLRKAGVPTKAIEDLRAEIVVDGRSIAGTCTETCAITCLVTCFVTGKGQLPGGEVINPG